MAFDVGAAGRHWQLLGQHNGKSFQDKRITRRPQIGVLAGSSSHFFVVRRSRDAMAQHVS